MIWGVFLMQTIFHPLLLKFLVQTDAFPYSKENVSHPPLFSILLKRRRSKGTSDKWVDPNNHEMVARVLTSFFS